MIHIRFGLAGIAGVCLMCGAAPPPPQAVDLAREYLALQDPAARQGLARQLDEFSCDPVSVVRALRPAPLPGVAPGYREAAHFETPELRQRYPDDLLYHAIPASYRAEEAVGLCIIMHGGSKGTERTMAHWYARLEGGGSGLGPALADSGLIGVAPSAPVSETCWERWCLPEADDYLRDVIREFENRFNIDPNRVFLIGHSMGGFGVYQHMQVQPDRFAAALVSAGSWYLAYWPVLRGTPLWLVHGVRDAEQGKRPHYTDVAFPRLAVKLLQEYGLAYEYREHPGLHGILNGMEEIRGLIAKMPTVRRDPFTPHVTVVTPRGWRAQDLRDAPHNRWLTILERTEGLLSYDATQPTAGANNWTNWTLRHVRGERSGALVDAINRGDNHFEVTTRNVRRFAIWLHSEMVDFSRPVQVVVNGRDTIEVRAEPSIAAALRSYERRLDWGLIYPAELRVTVEP